MIERPLDWIFIECVFGGFLWIVSGVSIVLISSKKRDFANWISLTTCNVDPMKAISHFCHTQLRCCCAPCQRPNTVSLAHWRRTSENNSRSARRGPWFMVVVDLFGRINPWACARQELHSSVLQTSNFNFRRFDWRCLSPLLGFVGETSIHRNNLCCSFCKSTTVRTQWTN